VVRASFHSRTDALRNVVVTQRNRDGIIVRPSTGESDSTILFAELSRLQVQRPPNRIAGSLSGGGLGLLAGVLLGAAFGSVAGDGPNFAPVGGALIGLPTGLVLGAILAPTRWAEVSLR
jgi:hypothetical protein